MKSNFSKKEDLPMKKLSMRRNLQPIKCRVQITRPDGKTHVYEGLFKSTAEAAMDAFERFGMVKVDARAA
jgi:hypothetical protein